MDVLCRHSFFAESSTATLRSTAATHDMVSQLTGTPKQLVTSLEKADWIDRLIILAALAFFILVVLFILKQRLVDRSTCITFWWSRYVSNYGGGGIPASENWFAEEMHEQFTNPTCVVQMVKETVSGSSEVLQSAFQVAAGVTSLVTGPLTSLAAPTAEATHITESTSEFDQILDDVPNVSQPNPVQLIAASHSHTEGVEHVELRHDTVQKKVITVNMKRVNPLKDRNYDLSRRRRRTLTRALRSFPSPSI